MLNFVGPASTAGASVAAIVAAVLGSSAGAAAGAQAAISTANITSPARIYQTFVFMFLSLIELVKGYVTCESVVREVRFSKYFSKRPPWIVLISKKWLVILVNRITNTAKKT
jgi:hypothetical protein